MNDQVSSASSEPASQGYAKYYLLVGIAGAVVIVLYLVFGGSGTSGTTWTTPPTREDPVQVAREALNKAADLNTCRDALTQINQLLGRQSSNDTARAAPAAPRDFLGERFELKDDEWAEISSDTFTLLDGHHLEIAFLLRDAAASFTRDGVLTGGQPLQRAEAAFAWTVRQVRLYGGRDSDADPLPVDFVLRRGYGTALERALVFLALLQQFDVPGCLIALKEPIASSFPLWCCGALVGRDIYLFDPRMGIPLPGRNGVGIATLTAAQTQPEVLKQLAVDDANRYDVTAEQASKARIYLALPLSALAPRMRYLQKLLQDPDVSAPVVAGRLGVDAPDLFQQFEDALARGGNKDHPAVTAWPQAARMLRAALPAQEGGLDKSQPPRWTLMRFGLVPLQSFPPIINRNMGRVYQMLVEKFGGPFLSLFFDPQQPRDALLRGHFSEASRGLTAMRKDAIHQKARLEGIPDLPAKVRESLSGILESQAKFQIAARQAGGDEQHPAAQEARANLENAWKQGRGWLDILIDGVAAGPFGQEVNYQLALAKHEQAERLQLRVEHVNRPGKAPTDEGDAARLAWKNAADWWTTYLLEYADASTAPSARFHAVRARLMLGEGEAALDLLRDHSKLTDLEKVGRTALARQLEQKK